MLGASIDVVLLEAAGLVDEAFEDAADRFPIERRGCARSQVFEQAALSLGIVDPEPVASLVVAYLEHDLNTSSHQLQDLSVDVVDLAPQLSEFWV